MANSDNYIDPPQNSEIGPFQRSLKSKYNPTLILKLVVTSVLLYFVVRSVDIFHVASKFSNASTGTALIASGFILIQAVLITSWRWQSVLAIVDHSAGLLRLGLVSGVGFLFNQLLPSTVGGDGMRMWLLHRGGHAFGTAAQSVVIDRMLGLTALLLLCFISFVSLAAKNPELPFFWGAALASLAGFMVGLWAPALCKFMSRFVTGKLRVMLDSLLNALETFWNNKRSLYCLILLSVCGHLSLCLAMWATARSLGVHIELSQAVLVLPAIMFVTSLPISVAGWGVREGSMIVGLGFLGVSKTDAVLVSVSYGVIALLLGIGAGCAWVVYSIIGDYHGKQGVPHNNPQRSRPQRHI